MEKSKVGIIAGGIAGLVVGAAAMYLSCTQLRMPQIPLDWAALVFTGLVAGLLTFFIVWGHFQKDPDVGGERM